MTDTYGITEPQVVRGGNMVHLVYSIPVPQELDLKLAVESMNLSIAKANYGFDARVRPDVSDLKERTSMHAALLYVQVPQKDHADSSQLRARSYGLALRVRRELPESDRSRAEALGIDPYLQTR